MTYFAEHLPPGFPPDLPAPEPLPAADVKDAEPLIDALGEYTARALYSKTWQLREAALISIERVLKGAGVEGHKGDLFKALSKAMSKTVLDKVANVFHGTLQVLFGLAALYACLNISFLEQFSKQMSLLFKARCEWQALLQHAAHQLLKKVMLSAHKRHDAERHVHAVSAHYCMFASVYLTVCTPMFLTVHVVWSCACLYAFFVCLSIAFYFTQEPMPQGINFTCHS